MFQKYKPLLALLLSMALFLAPMTAAGAQIDPTVLGSDKVSSGTLEGGITWLLDRSGTLYINGTGDVPNSAFESTHFDKAADIKSLVIGEGITAIGYRSFWGLSNLENASLPDSLKQIKAHGLSYCHFSSLELPEGLEYIDRSAFQGCRYLKEINIPSSVKEIGPCAFMICESLKSIEIPYGIETLENATFAYCSEIEDIKIPNTVTVIEGGNFAQCRKLETIDIPESVKHIGGSAFKGCSSLKEIKLPEDMEMEILDSEFFRQCTVLETVDFPSNVRAFSNDVFTGCDALVSFTVPDTVRSLGISAFSYCKNLKTIQLPKHLENIYYQCFRNCTSIETITIPETVKRLENDIFENCSNLSDIYLYADTSKLWWANDREEGYKPNKETVCHVLPQYLEEYQEKYADRNVTFKAVQFSDNYKWEVEDGILVCIGEIVGEDGYLCYTETSPAVETVIKPTCEEDGRVIYTAEFENEDLTVQTMDSPIPKTGHKWSIAEYEWNSDNSHCTAVTICENDASHIKTETAVTVRTVTKAPACEEEGISFYEADFEDPHFSYQTKDTADPALGHKWSIADVTWEGLTRAVASLRCENDDTHTSTCDMPITKTTVSPTCEEKGYTTYKATYEDVASERVETLDELGHKWSTPFWEWNEDKAELVFCCENNALHIRRYSADVSVSVIEPTEESEGIKTYTASATADNAEYNTQRTEIIPKLPPKGIYGDVDIDGKITAADALLILRASVGAEEFTESLNIIADISEDGVITADDALAVLRASVGMKDDNLVGEKLKQ